MMNTKKCCVGLLNSVTLRSCLILATILIFQLGSSQAIQAAEGDLKIVSADDRQMTLVVTPPKFKIESGHGPGGQYQRIQLPGWAKTTDIGLPELPVRGMMIPVPPSGDIRVEVLSRREKTRHLGDLYPVPAQRIDENGQMVTEVVKDEGFYGSSGFYPGSLAEVGPRSILKGKTMARLVIRPFQWDPATKVLRFHSKLRLRVTFESVPAVKAAEVGDSVMTVPDVEPQVVEIQEECSSPIRMEITEEGIYRIYGKDLLRAGFSRGIMRPDNLHLYNDGQEVALKMVTRRKRRVKRRDYIEFYAKGSESAYTDTNVYWMHCIEGTAKKMETSDGTVSGSGQYQDAFRDRVRIEENHVMWEATPGAPGQDYWFWEKITATNTSPNSIDYPLEIPSPATNSGDAGIRVFLQGRSTAPANPPSNPNHHVRILLNGTEIGSASWHGETAHIEEMTVSETLLLDGANTLTIEAPGDTGAFLDIFYLNAVEVDYWRNFDAAADVLPFGVDEDGRAQMEVTGLSTSDIHIFDVTDHGNVREVVDFNVVADGIGFKAVFEDDTALAKEYFALSTQAAKTPANISMWPSADLKNTANGADYILITARDFIPQVDPLLLLRQQQGLATKAVAVEDIYNQFNYGLIDPAAIKDFLRYAYENWTLQPSYVLLLGHANTDYLDYMETGKSNVIPVHLEYVQGMGLMPDDNWYACVQGEDVLPELMIGRIPAGTPGDAAAAAAKIVAYETNPNGFPQGAVFAADDDSSAYAGLCNTLIEDLPAGYDARKIYLPDYVNSTVGDARGDLISAIDAGMLLTTYVGHGAVTQWTGEGLFKSEHVPALDDPGPLTFALGLTCLSAYFSHPQYYSLAEEMVLAPGSGSIGTFAPSGLAYQWEHNIFGDELFANIFQRNMMSLGEITTEAKNFAYDRNVSDTAMRGYTLIGDPATLLNF